MIEFIEKINDKIKIPYLFYTGKFNNINTDYFVNKINNSLEENNDNSFKTNVQANMTHWKLFCNDKEFLKLMCVIFDEIDKIDKLPNYYLAEAWGNKHGFGHYTKIHNHTPSLFSGVVYLNDNDQYLEFPKINKKVKPSKGSFVIFNSFLDHFCKRNLSKDLKYGISFNCFYKDSF